MHNDATHKSSRSPTQPNITQNVAATLYLFIKSISKSFYFLLNGVSRYPHL